LLRLQYLLSGEPETTASATRSPPAPRQTKRSKTDKVWTGRSTARFAQGLLQPARACAVRLEQAKPVEVALGIDQLVVLDELANVVGKELRIVAVAGEQVEHLGAALEKLVGGKVNLGQPETLLGRQGRAGLAALEQLDGACRILGARGHDKGAGA